jgi:hypothetical protein
MSLEREKKLSLAILLFAVLAQAVALWPEIYTAGGRSNDAVNHYTMIRQIVDTIEQGGNPLDFWSPEISLGVPMVRTYQPLAHFLVVAVYFLLGKSVPLMTVLVWARYLSAIVIPISFYAAMLLLEFSPLTAAAAALLMPMIAGPGLGAMGLDIRSWVSFGIYPQSIATSLLLIAMGLSYRAIRTGKNIAVAGAVLGLTCLSHLMYGWMGAVAACMIALLPDPAIPRMIRIRRTVALGAVSGVLAAFQLIPLFTDGYLINRARFEPAEKFDSYGATQVLKWLFSGEILDQNRAPVLTLLCLAGFILVAWRWKKARKIGAPELFVIVSSVLWLLVFFGRSTWGVLLLLLGIGRDFHLHRLLATVQIFMLMLGAMALAALWRELARRWNAVGAGIVTLLLLTPMAMERMKFLNWHEGQGWETRAAIATEGPTLNQAIKLVQERGGRVYAGLPSNWEQAFTISHTSVSTFMLLNLVPAVSFAYNSSVFPADAMWHFDELNTAQYRLFNVRTVVAPAGNVPPFLTPVAEFGRFRVLNAPGQGYFGLVDVVAAAEVNRDTVADVSEPWVKSDLLPKDQYIWLDFNGTAPRDLPRMSPGGPMPPATLLSPAGSVTNEKQTGQVYEADFDATRPAYALFRMTYHFCWTAYIDGQPQKTIMLTPGFLGVAVPPGKHHILCRYEPGNAKLWEALAGIVIALLLIAGERLLSNKRTPATT